MGNKKDFDLIKDTIKFPVHYDDYGQQIFDAENNLVCEIRGWGRIQYMSEPQKRQDTIGKWITGIMNQAVKNAN